ncbi:MAG: NAD(P)-dependent oxidoreductase [Prevotella sp.]|nr:NAD(P)-dependent oxidoreductase [Prevotella sp.]
MKTLLITGAGPHGITGRLIKEYFKDKYILYTPGSKELDLTNDTSVTSYFAQNSVDYVIHCATFRPTSVDKSHLVDEELESNLRMFYSLVSQSDRFEKMIYFGSGAEFDKSQPIVGVSEEDFGRSIPKNKYGLAKYIMNDYARKSRNIYNFRLFGTINKYERFTKNVISNLCVKAIKGIPVELRQDCRFSFVDISDILPFLDFALCNDLNHHDYNIVMDQNYLLSDIAKLIIDLTNKKQEVEIKTQGLNLEYTASNNRIKKEFSMCFTPIGESVKQVYDYYYQMKETIDVSDIDARWK